MRGLSVEHLSVRGFRNISSADLELAPTFNVVHGDNGHGKTNLLEALYVLGSSKSFRASKVKDCVQFGAESTSVRASVREDGLLRTQSVGIGRGARSVKVDDKRPPSLSAYAVKTPMVVFHPGEIVLSTGPGAERRRLLDRVSLFFDARALETLDAYARALKSRQRVLEQRGTSAAELDAFEELVVQHGMLVMEQRARAASELVPSAEAAFARIAAPGLVLRVSYEPSAPSSVEDFRRALVEHRERDARRGSASVGPHRDDLALSIDERSVRGVASQGQHRAVTLALKAAEIDVVGRARGARPVLLLDDVSSELDRERTAALFRFLSEQRGQVFLSTTRPEMLELPERASLVVRDGVVRVSA